MSLELPNIPITKPQFVYNGLSKKEREEKLVLLIRAYLEEEQDFILERSLLLEIAEWIPINPFNEDGVDKIKKALKHVVDEAITEAEGEGSATST